MAKPEYLSWMSKTQGRMGTAATHGSVIPACPQGRHKTQAGETAEALGQQAICSSDSTQTLFMFKIYLFFIFCAWVLLSAYVYIYHMCAWYL